MQIDCVDGPNRAGGWGQSIEKWDHVLFMWNRNVESMNFTGAHPSQQIAYPLLFIWMNRVERVVSFQPTILQGSSVNFGRKTMAQGKANQAQLDHRKPSNTS